MTSARGTLRLPCRTRAATLRNDLALVPLISAEPYYSRRRYQRERAPGYSCSLDAQVPTDLRGRVRCRNWTAPRMERARGTRPVGHDQIRRKPEDRDSAWYTTRTTTAPMVATTKLLRLSPLTPLAPKLWKSQPPTTAPPIPRRTSTTMPSPLRLTILLAMNPATSPRMIHAIIDIRISGCF